MPTNETKVVIDVSAKGFEQAARKSEQLGTAGVKAADGLTKGFKDAAKQQEHLGAAGAKAADGVAKGFDKAEKKAAKFKDVIASSKLRTALTGDADTFVKSLDDIAKVDMGPLQKQFAQLKEAVGSVTAEDIGDQWKQLQEGLETATVKEAGKLLEDFSGKLDAIDSAKARRQLADFQKDLEATGKRSGMEDYLALLKPLQQELEGVEKAQQAAYAGLSQVDEGTTAHKAYQRALRDSERSADSLRGRIERLNRAFREQVEAQKRAAQEQTQARGAFGQGVLQGMLPQAAMLQRGPGMRRQFIGMGVGRAARGMASGVGRMFTDGLGGLQAAAGAIPGIGGLAAGQIGQAASMAGGALSLEKQRLAMVPTFAGGAQMARRMQRVGGRARADVRAGASDAALLTDEQRARRVDIAGQSETERMRAEGLTPEMQGQIATRTGEMMDAATDFHAKTMLQQIGPEAAGSPIMQRSAKFQARKLVENQAEVYERVAEKDVAGEIIAKAAQTEQDKTEKRLNAEARGLARKEAQASAESQRRIQKNFFKPIRQAGLELLGVSEAEALQAAGGMLQQGGTQRDLREQGMLRTGFAAQRVAGIGGDVSGAFLQAGRRGGMVGAEGRAGEAMTQTLADAMKLGLEGAEINQYMQQMAAGITQWQSTGIPVNRESISGMGQALGKMGVDAVRGQRIAGGVMQAAQGLTTRGPQTATDMLMLQTMGGFKGGGAEGLEAAQLRLEQMRDDEGNIGGEQMQKMFEQLMGMGGGGAGGRILFRRAMQQMGVQVGVGETQLMQKQMEGGELTEDEQALMARAEKRRARGAEAAPKSAGDLEAQAKMIAATFGKNTQDMARIQNEQNEIGQKMIPVVKNLQIMTAKTSAAFTEMAAAPLRELTGGLTDMAKELPKAVTALKKAGGAFSGLVGG